ncbi:MAG: hypothetical protein KJ621_08890 [Proteobacteria bacterium]|nr:hypothetical protein [Pseudomonadota bacterium]MBU1740946.1 hypothetical protein [Pseudomonadota bacterium]
MVEATFQHRHPKSGPHRATVIFEAEGGRSYEYPLLGIEELLSARLPGRRQSDGRKAV